MKSLLKSASAGALLAMLAACGGGAEEEQADNPDVAVTDQATAPGAVPAAGETPLAEATPSADASPSTAQTPAPAAQASPSSAPTASRAPAAAAPVQAAAAKPPIFAVCAACHSTTPGDNGIGPSLAGIYGEKAAEVPGFEFSEAMKSSGLVWSEANLDRYLKDPKGTIPGNKMAYAGLKNDAQRQAVIDYLKSL